VLLLLYIIGKEDIKALVPIIIYYCFIKVCILQNTYFY